MGDGACTQVLVLDVSVWGTVKCLCFVYCIRFRTLGNPPSPARLLGWRAVSCFGLSACPGCCRAAGFWFHTCSCLDSKALHKGFDVIVMNYIGKVLVWNQLHYLGVQTIAKSTVFLSGYRQPSLLKTLMGCLIRWWKLFTVGDLKFCHFNNAKIQSLLWFLATLSSFHNLLTSTLIHLRALKLNLSHAAVVFT